MVAIECFEHFQAVSRDVARARECPPVPKCTRLVPATNGNLATTGNTKCPFAGFPSSPLTDSNRRPPPYHGGFGLRLYDAGRALTYALSLQFRRFSSWLLPSLERTLTLPGNPRACPNTAAEPCSLSGADERVSPMKRFWASVVCSGWRRITERASRPRMAAAKRGAPAVASAPGDARFGGCPRVRRMSFREWANTVVGQAAAVGSQPSDTPISGCASRRSSSPRS